MMRRQTLPAILALALALAPLAAADSMGMTEGDIDSVRVYSAQGVEVDPLEGVTGGGQLISTSDSPVAFSFGDARLALEANTIAAVTEFDGDNAAEVYLLEGSVGVTVPDWLQVTLYTSTASYGLPSGGEYLFTYTADTDTATNLSDNTVMVYDALRRTSSTISPMSGSDLMANRLDYSLFPGDEAEAAATGESAPVVETVPVDEVPDLETLIQEAIAEQLPKPAPEPEAVPEFTVRGTLILFGETFGYEFTSKGEGRLVYPTRIINASDIWTFLWSYAHQTDYPEVATEVVHDTSEEGVVYFTYPADTYTQEQVETVVDEMLDYLDFYFTWVLGPEEPEAQETAAAPSEQAGPATASAPAAPSAPVATIKAQTPPNPTVLAVTTFVGAPSSKN